MATNHPRNLRHILVSEPGRTYDFRNPRRGGPKPPQTPGRNAKNHAARLKKELQDAVAALNVDREKHPDLEGYHLTIRSEPGFELPFERLDSQRNNGPKLLAVRKEDTVTVATIFVPFGGLTAVETKIDDYGKARTAKGRPKNEPLIASMESIRLTVLRELWSDSTGPFPALDKIFTWEAWLRNESSGLEKRFIELCQRLKVTVGKRPLHFPDRTVVLVHATAKQLARSVELVDCLAELRKARLDVADFANLPANEQARWADDLLRRALPPSPNAPVVCILDTGVNRGHPLLMRLLPPANVFSYLNSWGRDDHDGHGTEMAGLAAYSDLAEVLANDTPWINEHGLESVKILPPVGSNPPDLYGAITIDSCAQPELAAPNRHRVFSMAVTTTDGRTDGRPSSWSATLDALAAGRDDARRRLFCVSIGNANQSTYAQYPDSTVTEKALDPSQAWNVLTVGAFTDKSIITEPTLTGWQPVAPAGDLSPTSSTSWLFGSVWPLKPDVVLEGGNVARDPTGALPDDDSVESLRLLTTNRDFNTALLTTTNATSAAVSQAAHIAGKLMAEYTDYWPETLRGLIVHSGRWTPAMTERFGDDPVHLARAYGHGVPSIDRARWSAQNALHLIVQSMIHPYRSAAGSIKAGEMQLHALPWPRQALLDLGESDVRLRVTLSYFVEPNPAERTWRGSRYAYASHQLRFDMQRTNETAKRFSARVNEELRDEEYQAGGERDKGWFLGQNRNRGSCHSDVWQGSAAELATRDHIAVYPVGGWWKFDKKGERWKQRVRYSLVVSIETDEEEVDLYTPVANMVGVPIAVEIE
jgi:hypothetical protein